MHTIEVDFVGHVFVDGVYLGSSLTKKEAALLKAVMLHSHVASREFILSTLYGGLDEPDIKIIDVFATKVRKKLGIHREAVQTAWGRGYYRHKDYSMPAPTPQTVAVHVDASGIEGLCMVTGEDPSELVDRLIRQETRRTYADAA